MKKRTDFKKQRQIIISYCLTTNISEQKVVGLPCTRYKVLRTMGLNMWCEPRCGGCGPLAGGVPLLEPELLDEPDDFGVGGRGLTHASTC